MMCGRANRIMLGDEIWCRRNRLDVNVYLYGIYYFLNTQKFDICYYKFLTQYACVIVMLYTMANP